MRKSGDTEKPWLPGFSGQAGTTSHCGLELSRGWSSPSVFSTHTGKTRPQKRWKHFKRTFVQFAHSRKQLRGFHLEEIKDMGLEIKIKFDFFFLRNKKEGGRESPWRQCFPCKEAGGNWRRTGLGREVLKDFLWLRASAETQEPWCIKRYGQMYSLVSTMKIKTASR